jgi:hypothetical protein
MSETRTVHDPFVGADVQISNRLVDRLRGKYASGPHLPNGLPEFGWRQFQATPINLEAATEIERLQARVAVLEGALEPFSVAAGEYFARNFNNDDPIHDCYQTIKAGQLFDARVALSSPDTSPDGVGE